MSNNDNDDGGGWETAPTRQSRKKSNNNNVNRDGKNKRGGSRGTGGRGGGGRGGGGFGGWARPQPPRPKPNADWGASNTSGNCDNNSNNNNSKKELTYLDAVPKRELTESSDAVTLPSTSAAGTFQSMLQQTSLTDLMADYGEEDKDFAKMVVSQEQQQQQQEESASKPKSNANANSNATNQQQRQNERNGVLAPHGRAPIHLELVSYGHRYGIPSEATGKGGYSRSRPLPPFDVRDLDRAPHHVAKLSGLSHHVKRELLKAREMEVEGGGDGNNGETDTATNGKTVQFEADKRSPVRRRTDDVAQDSAAALAEAIEDGYGHASPLDMTVYIGSEYGRHRSVVIVEAAAITLRNMLRKNERNRFGTTPVSVGTRHRDVDRAHRDEEAFGYDLRREAQAAKKQKEREERESEGRW